MHCIACLVRQKSGDTPPALSPDTEAVLMFQGSSLCWAHYRERTRDTYTLVNPAPLR